MYRWKGLAEGKQKVKVTQMIEWVKVNQVQEINWMVF